MITYEEFLALIGADASEVSEETYKELVGNREGDE